MSNAKARILVVDDEPIACANLASILEHEGYETTQAHCGDSALKLLEQQEFDVVLTDYLMQPLNGLELLLRLKSRWHGTEVIVVTAFPDVGTAVEVMRAGAYYYLAKPYEAAEARMLTAKALEKRKLYLDYERVRTQLQQQTTQPILLGDAPPIREVKRLIARVAPSEASVLIEGDTGTGKELAARSIHSLSRRADKCFMDINCGALSEDLLDNELFGHEAGAYTGAAKLTKGLFEMADGGTIFLDEVGEMTLAMQVKLLRCLQERTIRRVGGTVNITVDVRIICATNKNLLREVEEGRFRRDLYYRLAVIAMRMPALSERQTDIPLLCQYFIDKMARKLDIATPQIAPETQIILQHHSYPGNVRELYNIMECALIMCGQMPQIMPEHLPESLSAASCMEFTNAASIPLLTLEELEKWHVSRVLAHTHNNKTQAARILGIDRASLWRKTNKYNIQ